MNHSMPLLHPQLESSRCFGGLCTCLRTAAAGLRLLVCQLLGHSWPTAQLMLAPTIAVAKVLPAPTSKGQPVQAVG